MKKSIRKQYTSIFVALLIGTMLVSVVCCALMLGPLYQSNRAKKLESVFYAIESASSGDATLSQDSAYEIEQLANDSSISGIIINSSGKSILSIGGNSDRLIQDLQFILFGDTSTEVFKQTNSYTIQKSKDMRFDGDNLILYGNLSNGNMVMLRITITSMQESTNFALRIIALVGLLVTLIGAVVVYAATRRITNPILELTEISNRMANLDFDAKYVSNGKNEIDMLGSHMNELSGKLETTISELKTANNELQLDLERKDKIEQMRTEFLSNVSHELKTPLALIQGYAEGLKDSIDDDAESRAFYCEVIIDEADKMNRMVRKLLTLNQLEFGEDEIEMKRFDLTMLVESVLSSMSIMLEQSDIQVNLDAPETVYVWADEYKTEEVLTNFLSNAVNHIDGEKIITVSITTNEETAHISVRNTGNPIPQEDLERLWEKFYKVDKSHSRQYGGSGIGLSIVKAIMNAMHQDFGVQNVEDGVEFWFELEKAR